MKGRREPGSTPVAELTAQTTGPPARASTRTGTALAWGASLVATAASTYALDAVATATGLLLAASRLLVDAEYALLIALLVLSYGAWAVGLTANLRQNHDLLSRTGASTSVLSKAAHDFAVACSAGPRARRFAAAAGYVGTELIKEVPYYVGAFGAVILTDVVSAQDALVFLIGANLGAAAYEYGLSWLTRALLARRYAIDRDPRAHYRRPFVKYTLQCEGICAPRDEQVACREELARIKFTRLVSMDGRLPSPAEPRYAMVISGYCADSATRDLKGWIPFMHHIMDRARPGGLFATAALRRSRGYAVRGRRLPSAYVDEHDLRAIPENAWGPCQACSRPAISSTARPMGIRESYWPTRADRSD